MSNTLLTPDVDFERLGLVDGTTTERLRLITGDFAGTIVDCRLTHDPWRVNFDIVSSGDSDLTITNTGLQQRVSDIVASVLERAEGFPTNPTGVSVVYDSTS